MWRPCAGCQTAPSWLQAPKGASLRLIYGQGELLRLPDVAPHHAHHNASGQLPVIASASTMNSPVCGRSLVGEDVSAGKGRKAQAKAADTLPMVAEHRLPHGVTSLCPTAAQGLPITAGTGKGDIFQLMLTKQVHALHSAASML